MAKETKPSIYSNRGTTGSSSELDEYGVWVKSEPQVLSSANTETGETSDVPGTDDIDFEIPEIEDFPEFDTDQEEAADDLPENPEDEVEFGLPEIVDENDENDDMAFDFGDMPESDDLADFPIDVTEESLDLPKKTKSDKEETDAGFTEISMDDFIGTLDTEPEEPAELPAEEPPELPAEEPSELSADLPIAEPAEESAKEKPELKAAAAQQELSTQLLMKIADELASIRTELSNLKKEFSLVKADTAAAGEEAGESGFFGEEDDEKIALTGDELNNILNTADFTEEAGADATEELSEDLNIEEAEAADDSSSDSSGPFQEQEVTPGPGPDVTPVEELPGETPSGEAAAGISDSGPDLDINLGETDLDELGGETKLDDLPEPDSKEQDMSVDLDKSSTGTAEEALPGFVAEETDELKQIREDGAEPISPAPAPEDEDFLTEDLQAGSMDEDETLSIADLDTVLDTEALAKDVTDDLSVDVSPDAHEDAHEDVQEDEHEDALDIPVELSTDLPEETIDLSEAVIDEPDLSGEIQDNPLEEPSLEDISINLDLDESAFDIGPEEEKHAEEPAQKQAEEPELLQEDTSLKLDSEEIPEISVEDLPEISIADEPEKISGEADSGADLSLIPEGFVVESEEAEAAGSEPPDSSEIPSHLKQELKTVLTYMDQLLESLPDEKIEEFARSEYYDTYKKLFKELGLV